MQNDIKIRRNGLNPLFIPLYLFTRSIYFSVSPSIWRMFLASSTSSMNELQIRLITIKEKLRIVQYIIKKTPTDIWEYISPFSTKYIVITRVTHRDIVRVTSIFNFVNLFASRFVFEFSRINASKPGITIGIRYVLIMVIARVNTQVTEFSCFNRLRKSPSL